MPDITREKFIEYWGDTGYQQVFDEFHNYRDAIETLLDREDRGFKNKTVLEIGCGNGYWTQRFLIPRFKKVIAVDLIEMPEKLKDYRGVEYKMLDKFDCSLSWLEDESIDFVWSYGVFCHFTNKAVEEYLRSISRVLKTGGSGMIMFANWDRHGGFKDRKVECGVDPEPFCGWTCSNLETVKRQLNDAGLHFSSEGIENFTSTMAVFSKEAK
jgi:cyclopropane fatty-acyl-phospholipid synthase-like methyltransferase